MGENTRIEWADFTFNPWIGCTKVSPACDNCYAEAQASRYWKGEGLWAGNRKRTSENNWRQPLKWNRQAKAFRAKHGRAPMVFCASLAEVFDNQVPLEWRRDLWELIARTPDLIWLLLTKRPQNIGKMLPDRPGNLTFARNCPPWGDGWPNVWLGTTVENQEEADRRIRHLLAAPAAKRFLSCEPLLGPLELRALTGGTTYLDALNGTARVFEPGSGGWKHEDIDGLPRIDWVIAGGESGSKARPSHPYWFRSLRDQCAAAGVPFLFKQWGEWAPFTQVRVPGRKGLLLTHDGQTFDTSVMYEGKPFPTPVAEPVLGTVMVDAGKKAAGRLLDGVLHDARPESL